MEKVIVITGSASGIGFNVGESFLQNGYKVIFSDINTKALQDCTSKFDANRCLGVPCDVSKEGDIKHLIETAKNHFGRIDVFINNAGLQYVAKIEDFPTEKFVQMLNIMLVGAFLSTKYVLPIMKEQNFGRIINMSSINGIIGFAGKVAYNSAKHDIIGLTKVTALECATHNITANAICPGYIDTPLVRGQMQDLANTRGVSVENVLDEVLYPLIPQKQLIDVKDIAALALFLSSNEAKHITGTNMVIDGGYTTQ